MDFFTVLDRQPKDIIYVMLSSFKQSKEDKTDLTFHLIFEGIHQQIRDYLSDLENKTFHLDYIDARDYANMIHPPKNSYLRYLKCLAPLIFPQLQKIVYLDVNTVCINVGIEDLWNIDMKNKCIAAGPDIQVQYNDVNQKYNTKNEQNYFNNGVLVMDLKKIRNEGIDKAIIQCLNNWPEDLWCIYSDQTLLNYLFRDSVRILSTKWNNTILSLKKDDEQYYMEYFQTPNLLGNMNSAIILYFKGSKPWQDIHSWQQWELPYRNIQKETYFQIYHQLGKPEEF